MVDEIHIKPFFDYKGGNITGAAHNSKEPANSALVFMVQSLAGTFKEVAHIVPVRGADGEFLHTLLRDVICGLEKIGYKIICVVTDNNKVNGKAMAKFKPSASCAPAGTSNFVYPHPCDPQRPLFRVLDTVRLLKCIRNNWINQKNHQRCFSFPEFDTEGGGRMLSASFETLREAYDLEIGQLLRFAYTLSRKSLFPSATERQNVKLALQIFNDTLSPALRAIAGKHSLGHVEGTSTFIDIVVKWWKIVNLKTSHKGQRLRDNLQEPLFPMNDPKVHFLYKVLDWLDEGKARTNSYNSGKLTADTHGALHQTTSGLIEVARYCFKELNLSHVLLEKFRWMASKTASASTGSSLEDSTTSL
ncbi:hypothetical protein HPB48_026165 [Haemaphysalis longicornis]|uniref:Transposable element P transposase-like RNase H domain-containing protein n=1 Tax=Haemaphysalis longicornis TaxID=44386 RepID=A0A9J6HA45_HAELO|nr:hypothetical protein HPB48_026165 [Haemaphysalis longicornis]